MIRVNYYAPLFGFVGWEVFTKNDENIIDDCIKIACSQMSKMLNESVTAKKIQL